MFQTIWRNKARTLLMGEDLVILQKFLCHRAFENVLVGFEGWEEYLLTKFGDQALGSLVWKSKERSSSAI
jgi:hypothetical protein